MPTESQQYLTMGALATIVLIPLLAFVGKLLLRSIENSMASAAHSIEKMVDTLNRHDTFIALLQAANIAFDRRVADLERRVAELEREERT